MCTDKDEGLQLILLLFGDVMELPPHNTSAGDHHTLSNDTLCHDHSYCVLVCFTFIDTQKLNKRFCESLAVPLNAHLTVKLIRNLTELSNGRIINQSSYQLFDYCLNSKVGLSECSCIQQTTDGMLDSLR